MSLSIYYEVQYCGELLCDYIASCMLIGMGNHTSQRQGNNFSQTFRPFISDAYKTDRQGLHWSDWQDIGALTQGAQEGQCVPISDCRACNA